MNVMDDIPNCDWAVPALVRRGELALAISTGGASPALARRLRDQLASASSATEWAEVVRSFARSARSTLPLLPDFGDRAQRWAEALDPDEAAALVRDGRSDELRDRLIARLLGWVTTP